MPQQPFFLLLLLRSHPVGLSLLQQIIVIDDLPQPYALIEITPHEMRRLKDTVETTGRHSNASYLLRKAYPMGKLL